MAFVPAPNILMVEIRATFDSQKIENRFMVDNLGPVDAADLTAVWNIAEGWAASHYFNALPAAIQITEIVVTDLTVQNGAQEARTPDPPFTGGVNLEPMPNEVTFCISLHSASRGRSARGRAYVLGLVKSQVTGNLLAGSTADGFRDIFQAWIDAVDASGRKAVVVSYVANKAPRPGGPVYFPILTASYADRLVDSMKRRKPGVGT